jgi:aspartate aminotransferase
LGYAAGPIHVIKAAMTIQSHSTSGGNSFAQYGAIAALEGSQDKVEEMRQVFESRRNLMVDAIRKIPGLGCLRPQGAFYVFPDISATGLDSMTFCQRLLEQEQVALVPGIAFGADDYVRLSYATDQETIEKGIERLDRFVRSL